MCSKMKFSFASLMEQLSLGVKRCSNHSDPKDSFFHLFKRISSGCAMYTAYGDQAIKISILCYGGTGAISTDGDIRSITISQTMLRTALLQLLKENTCIKVWSKDALSKSKSDWILEQVVTPGDISSEPLLQHDQHRMYYLASVVIEPRKQSTKVVVAFYDHRVSVFTFEDDWNFSKLRHLFFQYETRECMVMVVHPDIRYGNEADVLLMQGFYHMLEDCNSVYCASLDSMRGTWVQWMTENSEIVRKLKVKLPTPQSKTNSAWGILEESAVISALCCLLQRLGILENETFETIDVLCPDIDGYMLYDTNSKDMLNVFDKSTTRSYHDICKSIGICDRNGVAQNIDFCAFTCSSQDRPRGGMNEPKSLFSLLNKCITPVGRALLVGWLKQPLSSSEGIKKRLLMVRILIRHLNTRCSLRSSLVGIPDISAIVCRMQAYLCFGTRRSANANTQYLLPDLVSMYKLLKRIGKMKRLLDDVLPKLNSVFESAALVELIATMDRILRETTTFLSIIESVVDIGYFRMRDNKYNTAADMSSAESVTTSDVVQASHASIDEYNLKDPFVNNHKRYQPEDQVDSVIFAKGRCLRISPTSSSDLLALDAAYQQAVKELQEEKEFMEDLLTSIMLKHPNEKSGVASVPLSINTNKRRKTAHSTCDSVLSSKEIRQNKIELLLEYGNLNGYHLRLWRRDQHTILGPASTSDFKDATGVEIVVISAGGKGGALFTTHKLKRISAKCSILRDRYGEAEKDILNSVMRKIFPYISCFKDCSNIIASLDCLASFSMVSESLQWCEPIIQPFESKNMKLLGLRNPLVETAIGATDYVSSDYDMNMGIDEHISHYSDGAFIVTGPNMGGKTTFLKAVGTACLLAQMGCFVPARVAVIPIYDKLLTHRMSDGNLWDGSSSFMADMLDIKRVLSSATSKSLVLLDEIGGGTSSVTGCGIAAATIHRLLERIRCTVICVTHFRDIFQLEFGNFGITSDESSKSNDEIMVGAIHEVRREPLNSNDGNCTATTTTLISAACNRKIRCFHVGAEKSVDESGISLNYKISPGLSSQSSMFAVNIAEKMSLPKDIIDYARSRLRTNT